MRITAAAAFLVLLGACGGREALQPAPGQSMPVAPQQAPAPPTTAELLEPKPIARPDRVDQPLRRSAQREDDRFDLPPPG